jgi:hypothetical protein
MMPAYLRTIRIKQTLYENPLLMHIFGCQTVFRRDHVFCRNRFVHGQNVLSCLRQRRLVDMDNQIDVAISNSTYSQPMHSMSDPPAAQGTLLQQSEQRQCIRPAQHDPEECAASVL